VARTERPVREQRDALGDAACRDAVPEAVVVEHAQLDLHGVDLRDPERLLQLLEADVAEADPLDGPVALEGGERAHARAERCARIGRVELIERDAVDAERAAARCAGRDQVARTPVRHPAALGPRQAALRRDEDPRAVAAPGGERPRDQPLVVAGLAFVEAVGVGRVEEVHARVEGGVQQRHGRRVVAVGRGRQPHAAEAEPRQEERGQ